MEMVKNLVLNVCVGEDGEMYVEVVGLSKFEWLDNMLDGVMGVGGGVGKEFDEVVKELDVWLKEEVSKYDVELKDMVVKLEKLVEEFKEKLKEFVGDEEDGLILFGGNWGVEYDNNYGVVLKLYEGVELEEVVEEDEE